MTYTLGFGEFATEGYNGTNQAFIWMIWFIASFVVCITFLNMLIAIMSNTFDKVMDSRDLAALKERINIMQDYRKVVTVLNLDKSYRYMVIIKPTNLFEITDEKWDGKVKAIKSAI